MKRPKKKINPFKKNPREKVCERCGNGGFTSKTVFRCMYCGYLNGIEEECLKYGVEVTVGGIDER